MSYLPAQRPGPNVEAPDAGCRGSHRLHDIRRRLDVVMSELEVFLIAAIVLMSLLMAAGPTLVGLFNVLPSLVLAVGLAAALLRLVWFLTSERSS
jgi:hypothetical protein